MNDLEQEKIRASEVEDSEYPDGIDVLDVLLVLAGRSRLIGFVTLAALLAGIAISLTLKPNFTATAVILPPQQSSPNSSLLGQLSALSALGGGGSSLGLKTPANMYVGILQSRTIADAIIAKFRLQAVYGTKKQQDTRKLLSAKTEIEAGKDGLIRVSVIDVDPNRASQLANAYVSELYGMNSNLAITEAAQRRVFFDQQLDGEKKSLAAAEDDLRNTQQRTGLIQLSGQAQVIIQTIAGLRAQIASREVEVQAMRTFATEQNPDLTMVQEEISTMRGQLAKLENDQQRQSRPGNLAVPAGRIPQDSLEYARKLREVKYHETLFDLLSRQYEAARIDEAKSAPIIQVIDRAVPPERKSGPHRTLITAGLGFLGFSLACAWAFVEHSLKKMRQVPEKAAKFDRLQSLLRLQLR
jgi:tyrosine-protein kinase Etk/Wzc